MLRPVIGHARTVGCSFVGHFRINVHADIQIPLSVVLQV